MCHLGGLKGNPDKIGYLTSNRSEDATEVKMLILVFWVMLQWR
jgi:hypothetical protein